MGSSDGSQRSWYQEIEVLLPANELSQRVTALGQQITDDYQGRSLCLVGVLKGCFTFYADLARAIDLPLRCDFIAISTYGDASESSGVVEITNDLSQPVAGLDVLVVEDIIDTGLTMSYLLDNLRTRRPRSVSVCALLEKPDKAKIAIPIDYRGFTIPNDFVVGYGLDFAGLYRNLPYVGIYHGQT